MSHGKLEQPGNPEGSVHFFRRINTRMPRGTVNIRPNGRIALTPHLTEQLHLETNRYVLLGFDPLRHAIVAKFMPHFETGAYTLQRTKNRRQTSTYYINKALSFYEDLKTHYRIDLTKEVLALEGRVNEITGLLELPLPSSLKGTNL